MFRFNTPYYFLLFILFSCSQHPVERNTPVETRQSDSLYIDQLKQRWRRSLYQTPDSIREVAEEMIRFAKATGNKKALISGNNMLAVFHSKNGDNSRALKIYQDNLRLNDDDPEGIASIQNNLGNLYTRMGDFDLALDAQLKGLKAEEALENLEGIAISHLNVSGVYAHLNDLDKAIENATKALKLAQRHTFLPVKMQSAFQIAEILIKKKEDSLSLIFADSVISTANKLGSAFGVNKAKSLQAKAYANQGNLQRALSLIREVKKYYLERGIKGELLLQSRTEIDFLIKLGQYHQAENIIETMLPLAMELREKERIADLFHLLAISQAKQGNYQSAYANLESYRLYGDSMLNAEKARAIEDMTARYETDKKETEIKALSQEAEIQQLQLQRQQNLLLGSGALILFLGIGGALVYRQRKLLEKQRLTALELEETRKRLDLERQYRASELKAIRSQMNPHFVFNALNSIQEYIMTNERKLAGKYLGKFSDLMRIYLKHSQVKRITLHEEIQALHLYMELETLRFEDSLNYEINVEQKVDRQIEIPSLLIQPYVENAFKHGLLHKQGDRLLIVNLDQSRSEITIRIKDNGIGRKASMKLNRLRHPNHQPFATAATQNRIHLLNQDRSAAIAEQIEDLYDEHHQSMGTLVTINIPLETQ